MMQSSTYNVTVLNSTSTSIHKNSVWKQRKTWSRRKRKREREREREKRKREREAELCNHDSLRAHTNQTNKHAVHMCTTNQLTSTNQSGLAGYTAIPSFIAPSIPLLYKFQQGKHIIYIHIICTYS